MGVWATVKTRLRFNSEILYLSTTKKSEAIVELFSFIFFILQMVIVYGHVVSVCVYEETIDVYKRVVYLR